MNKKTQLINEISNKILEIVNISEYINTSDLQGLCDVEAQQLLKDLSVLFGFSLNDLDNKEV